MGRYKLVQTPQYIETLTCGMYHEANSYQVIYTETGEQAFNIEEISSILWRCACLSNWPPSHRPYESRIYNNTGNLISVWERPCKCSYLWIWRPEVVVLDTTQTAIGRIVNPCPPFVWCNMKVTVQNEAGLEEYSLSLWIWNFHVCWEWWVGPCSETEITVTPGDGMEKYDIPHSVKKVWGGFAKECYSAADEYEFDVPENWNEGQWAKFLGALQLFDMLFFEQYFQCFVLANIKCSCYTC